MKFLLISLFFSCPTVNLFSQIENLKNSHNGFDSTGKKSGYWIETDRGVFKAERYYSHGIKDGIEKVYYRNGSLMVFLQYTNGQKTGIGYYFHEKGHLNYTIHYMGWQLYKGKKMRKGVFILFNENGKRQPVA